MTLWLIGYWKESLKDEYPLPQELETEYAPELRTQLAAYLESGTLLVAYRGLSWCRYGCVQPHGNGCAELFDGVWAWPEGLAHYVRHHAVALPPDFVLHATRQNASPPPAPENAEDRRSELDDSQWIEWARSYRTPAVARLLAAASEAASRACEATLAALAAELTARHGIGEGGCAWADCRRRALVGKAICADHIADNERKATLLGAEVTELHRLIRGLR